MIKVEEIHVKEFRGIRDYSQKLKGKNFAICGPNGTGKSGIVDALEFALTGDISRLKGIGTGDISLKSHGPHVDCRNNPEKASVQLLVFIPALNKKVTLKRTVKNPNQVIITPDTPEIQAVLKQISLHPEISLSRREIIKYILAEPGKRSTEIQALLRLNDLESLRGNLLKIVNSSKRDLIQLEIAKNNAIGNLKSALNITQVSGADILEAINARRSILNLPPLSAIGIDASIKDGLATHGIVIETSKIVKNNAIQEVTAAKGLLIQISQPEFLAQIRLIIQELFNIGTIDPNLTSKEELLQKALIFFDDENCPVCDTAWEASALRGLIDSKLQQYNHITKLKKEVTDKLDSILPIFENLKTSLRFVYNLGSQLPVPLNVSAIKELGLNIKNVQEQIIRFNPINETIRELENFTKNYQEVIKEIAAIEVSTKALPEPSQQDIARDYLVVGQERLDAFWSSSLRFKIGKLDSEKAIKIYNIYTEQTTQALEKIYKEVEASFIELYTSINDDETDFKALLTPSTGKLGFNVDFYGRGFFPPGAYHSEGHQDSMGLCLYLALMKHLLKENFTFSVLDDVMMSVDSGHRREVSKMLIEKFPKTQFVLTTHDEVWLRLMKSAGLIDSKSFVHFRKWTVDQGPTEWEDRDVWQQLADYLENNEVRAAAALLRNFLEHIFHELCDNLGAKVVFRSDGQYTLGDLLPNAIGELNKTFSRGKTSAQSWKNLELRNEIVLKADAFKVAVTSSNAEQWQLNSAVHYNAWADLNKSDFAEVIVTYKTLLDYFRCDQCQSLLYIIKERNVPQTLRCSCAKININLVENLSKIA